MKRITNEQLDEMSIKLVRQEVQDEFMFTDATAETMNKVLFRKADAKKKEIVRMINEFQIVILKKD